MIPTSLTPTPFDGVSQKTHHFLLGILSLFQHSHAKSTFLSPESNYFETLRLLTTVKYIVNSGHLNRFLKKVDLRSIPEIGKRVRNGKSKASNYNRLLTT